MSYFLLVEFSLEGVMVISLLKRICRCQNARGIHWDGVWRGYIHRHSSIFYADYRPYQSLYRHFGSTLFCYSYSLRSCHCSGSRNNSFINEGYFLCSIPVVVNLLGLGGGGPVAVGLLNDKLFQDPNQEVHPIIGNYLSIATGISCLYCT
ncbi:MAG: hypothetical protein R2822_28375 [Spirosomataceae bacterium]